MVKEATVKALDVLVKYWIIILSVIGMIATVAIAGDQIEKNRKQIETHEMRLQKLEQIGRDIHNLKSNQNKILDLLLQGRRETP